MADLAQIRAGFKSALDAIPHLQASAYMLGNPTLPSAHVFPDEIEYDKTFGRGHDAWFMTVQAFVGLTSDIGAQKTLDKMLAPSGAYSVKAALEADSTLGGIIDDLRVVSCTGYRTYQLQSIQGLVVGAEWRVQVIE